MRTRPLYLPQALHAAVREGRITQIRQVVKPQPVLGLNGAGNVLADDYYVWRPRPDEVIPFTATCAYRWMKHSPYQVGDLLWLREGWGYSPEKHCRCPQPSEAVPCDRWMNGEGCDSASPEVTYRADHDKPHRWRSPITMPRWAARYWFRVKDVRAERLRDATDEDAVACGCTGTLLQELCADGAKGLDLGPECWIVGADEGLSYCKLCGLAEMERLQILNPNEHYLLSKSYSCPGDSIASCEACGKTLSNCLTDYGAESEMDHFLEYGLHLDSTSDCNSMVCITDTKGCDVEGLPRIALRSLFSAKPDLPINPWTWVYTVEAIEKPEEA